MQHLCGWVDDQQQVIEVCQSLPTPFYAGPEPIEGKDVFLWQIFDKIAGKPLGKDIQRIGDCVSWGFKHFYDITQAVQIDLQLKTLASQLGPDTPEFKTASDAVLFEFKECSSEAIYGLSRVEIGGGQIRGDGSVGAWAAKALYRFGGISRAYLQSKGLNPNYDPQRAKDWGYRGLPDEMEPEAKEHGLMAEMSLVTDARSAAFHIQNGRPVPVCSNVGFENGQNGYTERDSRGFARPRGRWDHCMCFIGVRWNPFGLALLNQWPLEVTYGPKWPDHLPDNVWWVDESTCNTMLGQRDSWTGDKVKGYPIRELTWRF